MSRSLKDMFSSYIKQDKRVDHKLRRLVAVLTLTRNSQIQISKYIRRVTNPIKLLKCLMLLHQCYLSNTFKKYQTLTCLLSCINNLAKPKSQLHRLITTKVLPQYSLYLQKLYQQNEQKLQSNYLLTPLQKIYRKINILRLAVDFIDIVYIFGRYLSHLYFVIDFNVVVACDARNLYDQLKEMLVKNREIFDNSIKMDLELVHEKMYVVYYNTYYYRYVKMYQPVWIQTYIDSSALKKIKSMQNKCSWTPSHKSRKSETTSGTTASKQTDTQPKTKKQYKNKMLSATRQSSHRSSLSQKQYKNVKQYSKRNSEPNKPNKYTYAQQQQRWHQNNIVQKLDQNVSYFCNSDQDQQQTQAVLLQRELVSQFQVTSRQNEDNSIDCQSEQQYQQQATNPQNLIFQFEKVIRMIDSNLRQNSMSTSIKI